jgi:hypothetical protein
MCWVMDAGWVLQMPSGLCAMCASQWAGQREVHVVHGRSIDAGGGFSCSSLLDAIQLQHRPACIKHEVKVYRVTGSNLC